MYKEKDFPKNFKFEKINNTVKVKATCREFFPYAPALSFMICLIILFFFPGPQISRNILINILNSENSRQLLSIYFLVSFVLLVIFFIILCIITAQFFKAEYTFSNEGINISFNKHNIFIKREDIKDIYSKYDFINSYQDKYKKKQYNMKYSIYVDFFDYLNLNRNRISQNKLNLFSDYVFKDENLVNYIVTEIRTVLFTSK